MELDRVKNLREKDMERILLCAYRMNILNIFLAWSWLKTSFYSEYNILGDLMHLQG